MVLVSTKDKRKIYEYLLQEGVFCCYKVRSFLIHFKNYFFIYFTF